MSRPSEFTRNSIVKAAVALFAERGYDGTSIRAIVSKARVNQAAINAHHRSVIAPPPRTITLPAFTATGKDP